jgi:RecG-like helicase
MQEQENLLKSLLKTTSPYLQLLKDNHIETVEDFCYMFPRAYEDRTTLLTFQDIIRHLTTIQQQQDNPQIFETNMLIQSSNVITKICIIKKTITRTKTGKSLGEVQVKDVNGDLGSLHTLHSTYMLSKLFPGKWYFCIGKPQIERGKLMFWHPECLPAEETPEEDLHI